MACPSNAWETESPSSRVVVGWADKEPLPGWRVGRMDTGSQEAKRVSDKGGGQEGQTPGAWSRVQRVLRWEPGGPYGWGRSEGHTGVETLWASLGRVWAVGI